MLEHLHLALLESCVVEYGVYIVCVSVSVEKLEVL